MDLEARLSEILPRYAELRAEIEAESGVADPASFARWRLGITLDPWQEQVLCTTRKRVLLNCSRQSGKSTTASILALYRAIHTANALVLLVSPSLRQSSELFRKVRDHLRLMQRPPRLVEDNLLSITLENGSRIVSLPGSESTIRGFSAPALIIEDEAGDVPDDLSKLAIRPMLAVSDGQLILMGTPKGRRGHFFQSWEHGGDVWGRVRITAHDCPRISAAFLTQERVDLGGLFAQEYECAFVNAATGRVYDGYEPERNRIEELPLGANGRPSRWTYSLGLDFGIIDQNGICVCAMREHDTTVYVAKAYRLTGQVADMGQEVAQLEMEHGFQHVVGDIGGMGKAFQGDIAGRHNIGIMPAQKTNKLGNITLLNGDLRRGRIKVVGPECADLIEEWETLPWAENPDHVERRQKEADGFPNHAADACLYVWRSLPAFLAEPAVAPAPKPGTEAWKARVRDAQEAELDALLERDAASARRKPWERDPERSAGYRGDRALQQALNARAQR